MNTTEKTGIKDNPELQLQMLENINLARSLVEDRRVGWAEALFFLLLGFLLGYELSGKSGWVLVLLFGIGIGGSVIPIKRLRRRLDIWKCLMLLKSGNPVPDFEKLTKELLRSL